ncbi:MAG: GNAT family N-acetyltransferase [Cyclobacteriaceae bacterium]
MSKVQLSDIIIRNELKPGDMGYVIYMHGHLYHKEYNFGTSFESYVSDGLVEFYRQYDPATNRVWVCEHNNKLIGFLVLMNRGAAAQLRYFILDPEYRGIGLGKKLMQLYMDFLKSCGYKKSYLWTTEELHPAISLYTRHGFKLTTTKDTDAFGKPLTEHRYDLVLE